MPTGWHDIAFRSETAALDTLPVQLKIGNGKLATA